ncbi:hypothetical protein [Cellulosimicrobium cellulans]|uniref:hypothetical protein n=1 Tax=Cellulosimicrobium cellulans TaxID=1710 RepID=UPI0024073C07|nr:hypothetical protein [Cellulosimicrobium cellulans]MDF9877464.1 hypothetical protein [Cellulosimicrobium cellulans]
MASGIEAAPFSLQDAQFIIGAGTGSATDYTGSVSHVMFAPSDIEWLDNTSMADAMNGTRSWVMGLVAWSLAIEYPQDWVEASSLSLYLALHAGEKRDVLFLPKAAGGTHQVRANVILAPGPIGGQAGVLQTGIVVMMVNGRPTIEEIP